MFERYRKAFGVKPAAPHVRSTKKGASDANDKDGMSADAEGTKSKTSESRGEL